MRKLLLGIVLVIIGVVVGLAALNSRGDSEVAFGFLSLLALLFGGMLITDYVGAKRSAGFP